MASKKRSKKQQLQQQLIIRIVINLALIIGSLVVMFGTGSFGERWNIWIIDTIGTTNTYLLLGLCIFINTSYLMKKSFEWRNLRLTGFILFIVANTLFFTLVNESQNMMQYTTFFYTGYWGYTLTTFIASYLGFFGVAIIIFICYFIAISLIFKIDLFENMHKIVKPNPAKKTEKNEKKALKKANKLAAKTAKQEQAKKIVPEVATYNDELTQPLKVDHGTQSAPLTEPQKISGMFKTIETVGSNHNIEQNTTSKNVQVEQENIKVNDSADSIANDNANNDSSVANASKLKNLIFKYPTRDLISKPTSPIKGDKVEVLKKSKIIEEAFASFGIKLSVQKVNIGPAVTQFEVLPATGVKVNQIGNLSDDIAMALAAKSIYMQLPIPGKNAIGIEVPNDKPSLVTFGDVFEIKRKSEDLTMFLGRDILGKKVKLDLNKTPHLLVAGSTGSGKSVAINSMILSLIMNKTPEEVRLVLIDPKQVELAPYEDIPHLLTPVVTDPKKAAGTLKIIVEEMDERYKIFGENRVRNITSYNASNPKNKMPYIVCIIDELADLMLVASKEVEGSIQRITQLARAAGIHLIIATQRPSVDVLTGVIKANIPSRIAFAVSSTIDSRTILDQIGADKLLGKGDMLLVPPGSSVPIRAQGAYVNDEEIFNVVDFLKTNQAANYEEKFSNPPSSENAFANNQDEEDDLMPFAVDSIIKRQKASVSILQRDLRIGYNRAARIIDILEDKNIISGANGTKPREVLVSSNPFKEV